MKPNTSRMSAAPAWKDWNVVRYARDGDFVLVTNNASDFRRLYAAQPLHAGLVISFRPIRNNRTGRIDTALDPDMVYTR